jgi:NAD(P)H-hydrate epimerase
MANKVIAEEGLGNSDFLVDALLGFSFKPPLRAPYDDLIGALKTFESKILSVDNPSGWDIEAGNTLDLFTPKYNIRYPKPISQNPSMMLPKLGLKSFQGVHYVGARFIPPQLETLWGFKKPEFSNNSLIKLL